MEPEDRVTALGTCSKAELGVRRDGMDVGEEDRSGQEEDGLGKETRWMAGQVWGRGRVDVEKEQDRTGGREHGHGLGRGSEGCRADGRGWGHGKGKAGSPERVWTWKLWCGK